MPLVASTCRVGNTGRSRPSDENHDDLGVSREFNDFPAWRKHPVQPRYDAGRRLATADTDSQRSVLPLGASHHVRPHPCKRIGYATWYADRPDRGRCDGNTLAVMPARWTGVGLLRQELARSFSMFSRVFSIPERVSLRARARRSMGLNPRTGEKSHVSWTFVPPSTDSSS